MDLESILLKIGGAALKSIPPLGIVTEILGVVNEALPRDKQLTESTTGQDAIKVISSLPNDSAVVLLEKKFDVELAEIQAHVDITRALADVDTIGNSTRPDIARDQSRLIGFGVVITLGPIGYAIITGNEEMVQAVADIWPLIASVLGISAGIVNSYFGKRSKEKAQKYEAITKTPSPVGLISQLIGKFTKG